MTIVAVFEKANESIKHWKLEGVDSFYPYRIFLSPVLPGKPLPPPYHLECRLELESPYTDVLRVASDRADSRPLEDDVTTIGRDIGARLDEWVISRPLTEMLKRVALGARFRLDGLGADSSETERPATLWLSPNLELQARYHTVSRLTRLWSSLDLPPTVDFEQLRSVSRLHDSVSLVLLPHDELAIFKGVVSVVARMYHELKELLRMPPHANVMGRPPFLVTRQVEGMDEPAVCGFILPYHPGGSMLDVLRRDGKGGKLAFDTRVKWVRQILDALLHIHGRGGSFYSDLRLNNLLLDKDGNVIVADFEQGGSPSQWLHPSLLNTDTQAQAAIPGADPWVYSPVNPANMPRGMRYSNPPSGYWKAFATATDKQRQKFETYTICKVMWCIFEDELNTYSWLDLDEEEKTMVRRDGIPVMQGAFPNFRNTPIALRYWIWLCTKESPEWGLAQCTCPPSLGLCGQTGALLHRGEPDGPEYGPDILDTSKYFDTWAAGCGVTVTNS